MADQTPWFVRKGERTHGPFTAQQLKQLATAGKIDRETCVRRGVDGQWVAAEKVKGLWPATIDVVTLPKPTTAVAMAATTDTIVTPSTPRPTALPSAAPERVPCPFCGEEILAGAVKCRHCHEFLDGRPREQPQPALVAAAAPAVNVVVNQNNCAGVGVVERRWNAMVAMLLSLVIPGLGQFYKGQPVNAIAWFLFVVAGYITFIVPGLVLHLCCILGAGFGNPYR